jgi:hypothetical protein
MLVLLLRRKEGVASFLLKPPCVFNGKMLLSSARV